MMSIFRRLGGFLLGNIIKDITASPAQGTVDKAPVMGIKCLTHTASMPERAHPSDAGIDIKASEGARIEPGDWAIIRTGLSFDTPDGYEVQIRPRSGLAGKKGITVLNSPGTIDSGYRGEIKIILSNTGKFPYNVHTGDRVAQMVIARVCPIDIEQVFDKFGDTDRGINGFGSTGK